MKLILLLVFFTFFTNIKLVFGQNGCPPLDYACLGCQDKKYGNCCSNCNYCPGCHAVCPRGSCGFQTVCGKRIFCGCCPEDAKCGPEYPYDSRDKAANKVGSCEYKVTSYTYKGKCGGKSMACYKRGDSIVADGKCPSGSYTSQSAAASDGSCSYNVTTTSGSGASCGGKNPTCYVRGAKISINGSCPSGTFNTQNEAAYYNGCSYNVTTTSGSGAKCGGTNPTCYRRGTIIKNDAVCPNGTFNTQNEAKSDGNCNYNVASEVYSGTCGGANRTCWKRVSSIVVNGACGTLNNQKFLHNVSNISGFTACTSGVANPVPSLSTPGALANWTCGGKCGGLSPTCSACRNKYPLVGQTSCSSGFTTNQCLNFTSSACVVEDIYYSRDCLDYKYICYKPKNCVETNGPNYLTAGVNDLIGSVTGAKMVFNSMAILVGERNGNNQACYKKINCSDMGPTTGDGNQVLKNNITIDACGTDVFEPYVSSYTGLTASGLDAACGRCVLASLPWWQIGLGNIYSNNEIASDVSNKCIGNCNQHLITASNNTCNNNLAYPGIPISNHSSVVPISIYQNKYTQRSTVGTSAYQTKMPVPTFEDISKMFNIDKINSCSSDWFNDRYLYEGVHVCKTSLLNINNRIQVPANKKLIIIVDGDVVINNEVIVPIGSYLLIVAKNDLAVRPSVGLMPSATNVCSNIENAQVQGVFIAENIKIMSFKNSCDYKFIGAGSFIAREKVFLERDLKRCSGGGGFYPNYNATHPAETFLYRPDFLLNTPEIIKQFKKMRLEVI